MSYGIQSSVPRFDMKKPVELNREYKDEIQEINGRGDGVAKIEGFTVFVENTKQGQHVKFKTTSVGSRFAIGELVQA